MTKCRHILSLFLLISPYLINGAPTTAPVSLPADDALSTYYCSDSPAWSGPSFYPKDCAAAMAQFFLQELLVHGDVLFEFLAVGARQRTRYPPQNMPEKFTYGTCTMAIVMLVAFYPEELPGIPPSTVFSLMDVASYADVWNAVREVMDNCISRYLATNETMQESGGGINFLSQTGWSAIGSEGAIGVFLWDTSSTINQRIHAVNLPADSVSSNNRSLQLANLTQSETAESRGTMLLNTS